MLTDTANVLAPSISFAQFMEQALYDPQKGYYAANHVRIGKAGDFFTNVSVGKIYGNILALFFKDLWEKMGSPHPFTIVEQGAHNGQLAFDILESAKHTPNFFAALSYFIVEPFSAPQKKQQETLKEGFPVSWVKTVEELPEFKGLHFSNELLDAFPINLLRWNGAQWEEQRVVTEGTTYRWLVQPIKQPELCAIATKLPTTLTPGFLWEVRLGIPHWLQSIQARMQRGMILVADYGYASIQRFAPYRAQGSIACYHNHQRYDNPLEGAGTRDISAHVDFTDLAEHALEQNFELLGYSDQHHFLIGAAEAWMRTFEGKHLIPEEQKAFRLLQTLLHPETMGRSFYFLGLGKNLSLSSPLRGFAYQRPGIKGL